MEDTRGHSQAALSLRHKTSDNEVDDIKMKKKKVIRDIINKKTGKDKFDPEPEIDEKDTVIKN